MGYRRSIDQGCPFHTHQDNIYWTSVGKLYISRIVCLHGVPKKIMSDIGTKFTLKFWEGHESMDTKLNFSSAYHP
jgi:hypothetical protein